MTSAKSVDPDKMQHYAAFHQRLHCLTKYPFMGFQYLSNRQTREFIFGAHANPSLINGGYQLNTGVYRKYKSYILIHHLLELLIWLVSCSQCQTQDFTWHDSTYKKWMFCFQVNLEITLFFYNLDKWVQILEQNITESFG